MTEDLTMPAAHFAAWTRRRALRPPYPIDLSTVDAAGVADEHADAPQLRLAARVLGDERLSVFMLRADPGEVTDCAVAVAADSEAVLLRQTGDRIVVRGAGRSELVAAIGATLPALDPMPVRATELTEAAWSQLLQVLAQHEPGDARRPLDAQRLVDLGLPRLLATAMAAGAADPVPVGTAAVMTWTRGSTALGPTVASWHEYPGGAVLTRVLAPRRPGGRTQVLIGPYHRADLTRTLTEAVSTALYRARD